MPRTAFTQRHADVLSVIVRIHRETGCGVMVTQIAAELGVSRQRAHVLVGRLRDAGLLLQQPTGHRGGEVPVSIIAPVDQLLTEAERGSDRWMREG